MEQTKLKPVNILSTLIIILMTCQALGGLFIKGLYRDNLFTTSAFQANDLITIIVAVPVLIAAQVLSMRGNLGAQLIWLGMLDYTLYNYAFYLFGTAFNRFFLIYVALTGLSIYALIFALINLDANAVSRKFKAGVPAKLIAGYMLFVALSLTSVYLAQSIGFIATGQVPAIVIKTGHITNVVFALDLCLVIPVLVLGAVWLWKRHPWGYILSIIINIKAALYMLILSISTVWIFLTGASNDISEVVIWGTICVLSLIVTFVLLGNLQSSKRSV